MLYERIKIVAKERGISISELERRLELAQGSICKWNEIKPAFDKVVKVANCLEISVEYLAEAYSDK